MFENWLFFLAVSSHFFLYNLTLSDSFIHLTVNDRSAQYLFVTHIIPMTSLPLFVEPSEWQFHFIGRQTNVTYTSTVFTSCTKQHMQDTTRLFLTNKKPLFYFLFFLSGKQNRCFIHYDPDYAQSSILSAQFKSKVILDTNISSKGVNDWFSCIHASL